MNKNSYPRFANKTKPRSERSRCTVCEEPAAMKVDIQTSFLRGEDEVATLCAGCKAKGAVWVLGVIAIKRGIR